MKNFTKFSLRFAIYLLLFGYLALDLYVIKGPLSRKIQASLPQSPESIAKAKEQGAVARVFNHQITQSQLKYAIQERLSLEGKLEKDLSTNERKWLRYAILNELIDHELLRVKTKVNTFELPVSEEEIEARYQRFISQFKDTNDLQSAVKSMGLSQEKALRNRIAARIQQEKYIAMRVDPLVNVSEEEISTFYATHREALRLPESIRAQHIFLATLERSSDQAKEMLEQAFEALMSKQKTFDELAKEISEDPATKNRSGDLGWMSRSRLPEELSEALFSLEKNQPAIISSKVGWHLVIVTDQKAAEIRSLAEVKPEIISALKTQKRHQAVKAFREGLRQYEQHKIEIFHDMLDF